MKASELIELNLDELNQKLAGLQKESFDLRMLKSTEQKVKPHLVRNARRNIARVKTIITQKKMKEGMQS